ncbi:MAG: ABC transporter permease [Dysgonamonadaceae bacterium]|jgi:ABC-2 type transport system permease protein|nr:ABC transporter permease [Dysgonamonadaceae bacterium]
MLKYLVEKEVKQIFRNAFLPKVIFIMPVVMLLILPWAADQEVKNLHLCVVDNDHSSYSERMIRKITASDYFRLSNTAVSNEEALKSIESGEADIILEIPPGFEKDLMKSGAAGVMISANAVNGMKGGLGSSYLAALLNDFSGELQVENGIQPAIGQVRLTTNYRFNPHLDYKAFMVPAIIVILLTILSGFLPALNIVSEKETGTIEQINVTPVGRFIFILAKLIPYWVIGFIIISIGFGIAAFVYRLFPAGSLFTIYLYAGIYILVVSGLGLMISNYSDTMQQAMFVIFFFIMILILMSGLFTPVSSMPEWAQVIAAINPLKYFMQVMRAVYLKGSGVAELLPQLGALGGFALFFNTWAVISYRKSK